MSVHDTMFPLAEQGPREEAESFGDVLPAKYLPPLKNYAEDEKIARQIQEELIPLMDETRSNRLSLENDWREVDAMVQLKHGSGRRYFGRSDMVLPVYRRERDKLISMLSRGLFPSDEYFDCVDKRTGDPEVAKPTKVYMQWELEKNARMRAQMKKSLSQLVDYGTAPMKVWYRKQLVSEGVRNSSKVPLPGMTMQGGMRSTRIEGMAVSPRRLQYWYIYPETAEDIDDAQMIFEDIDVSVNFIEAMKRAGKWVNIEKAIDAYNQSDHQRQRNELLASRGMTNGAQTASRMGLFPTVTEVWTFMRLPRGEYMEWEDPEAPVPVRIVLAGAVPLEVRRNPFFHQRPPYVVGRIGAEAGFFYGNAMGQTMRALQVLATDFMNQTNDNGIMALNPIALINPGLMMGPPRPFSPGVPWHVSDVDKAVKFERPPTEQVGLGISIAQMLIGMAQDMGGAPPDRSATSRGAKTATGMQIMQNNAIIPMQDSVEDLELDMMVRALYMGWKNAVQYREDEVMAAVAGQRLIIHPEMLDIEADFTWIASSQAANNQVRSQQALSLIQAIAPLVPLFNQQGYVVDFSALVRRVYVEGFGFRGFDQFIYRGQGAPQQGMPMTPQAMQGVQQEQGDRMRSALEQVPGGTGLPAQPGEANEFMVVRQNADELAGDMGEMLGGTNMGGMDDLG